jgi:hypothetical protein
MNGTALPAGVVAYAYVGTVEASGAPKLKPTQHGTYVGHARIRTITGNARIRSM